MQFSKSPNLKKYVKAFIDFEQYIKDINNIHSSTSKNHRGYLINQKIIEEIKNKINYKYYKNKFNEFDFSQIDDIQQKDCTCEEIEFRDSNYLLNMLFNGNKYILINVDLWQLLCKEGKENTPPIIYEINYSQIKFKLDEDQKIIIFSNYKNNNNLIEKQFFYDYYNPEFNRYKFNYDNIVGNIFRFIKGYYKYEKEFKDDLKYLNKGKMNFGYLVDFDWFNELEKFYDYLNIKSNYLDQNKDQKEIIDYIIYVQTLNTKKQISLGEPKINKFHNKNHLDLFLKKNKLVLIDTSLITSSVDLKDFTINYQLYDNKVEFFFHGQEPLIIDTKDNIIFNDKNNSIINNNNSNLLQLSKLFYFRKSLIKNILKKRETNDNGTINKIILVKKEVINKYKSLFNYDSLSSLLDKYDFTYENLSQKFDEIKNNLESYLPKYNEDMKKKENNWPSSLDFTGSDFYLIPKTYKYNNNLNLKYVSDFVILDEDIYSFFKENQMIQEDHIIKGEYFAEEGKIFLKFKYYDSDFFEIGTFDISTDSLIIEYIVEGISSLCDKIINYFKNHGIKEALQKVQNDAIQIGVSDYCFCYKISLKEKEESPNININMIDNQYNINEIISTLITLNKHEQDIKKKLDMSKSRKNDLKLSYVSNPFQTMILKLVSETFINEIKNIFDYQKLKKILDKYQINYNQEINNEQLNKLLQMEEAYNKYLYSKKNAFIELKKKAINLCKIDKIDSEIDGQEFHYPINFNAIDDNLYDKILNILELKVLNNINNPKAIFLTYNNGNIVFRGYDDKFLGNKNSLLYIYSFYIQQDLGEIKYCPEAILCFQKYSDLINNFQKIINEKIMEEIMNPQNKLTKYGCEICLNLNQDNQPQDTPQINDLDLYDNNKEKYINKLLEFSFSFNLNYKYLYLLLKNNGQHLEEKMFLINKKYIDEIKLITHFNELEDVIQKHPELKNDFNRKDSSYLYKLKSYLDRNILIEFFNTKKNDIKKKLNDQILFNKSSKHLHNDELNNLFYYDNFQLINKSIFNSLKELDSHFDVKCIVANIIISQNKIILFLQENENYVINVGQINKTDEFELEYLIQSEETYNSSFDLKKIFGAIKTCGYHYFKQNIIKNDHIQTKIDHITVKARIYRLSSEVSNDNNFQDNDLQNNKYISDKTKAIILLSTTQNLDINKFNINKEEKLEKVYLMDYNYLLKYKYLEISSLINGDNEIQKSVEKINNPQNPYISNTLDEIISKLNQEELKKIDRILQTIDLSKENWEARANKIILQNGSSISVYKEFIIIKERIYKEISNKLSLNRSSKQIDYAYKDGDIIAIHDRLQPCLFFGQINNNHFFNLKYFLVFDSDLYLKKALQFILSYGIEQYKKEKTIFSEGNKKDLISIIYDNNYEIGNFYIYSPGANYGKMKENDYTYELNNEKLDKVLKLYNYYNKFKQKMKAYNNYDEKYFLIKKEIMNDIKKDYNYDTIIQILEKAPINKNESNLKKQKLYILKNFPEDLYDDFFDNKKPIEKRMKDYTFPDSISITIPNTNQSIQIYENFEIIEKSIASEFISGIYGSSFQSYSLSPYSLWPTSTNDINEAENYINCTLKEGKVIVYYPKTKFNDNAHVYALGSLNDENIFIAEYLLIYKRNHEYFSVIKNELNNYLQSIEQQLMYGPCPLTNNKYEEIGMVVGLSKISKSNIHKGNFDQNQIINSGQNDFYPKPNDGEGSNGDMIDDEDIDPNPLDPRIIEKYNLDSVAPFSKIKECFNKAPLIGLDNIGATCYMNATLQCLCNIPQFVNYFKFNKNLKDLVRNDITYGNNSMLCSSFKLLIEQLWPDRLYFTNNTVAGLPSYGSIGSNNTYSNKKNESFPPNEFKKKISSMNDLFKGVAANDAKDLVNFLIMTLHAELNTAEKKDLNTNAINQDQRNQQLMFNLFTQDFVNSNKSIISDLFYGVNYNIVQCNGCGERSFNYQTYFFFVFPLEEVRIFKSQNNYNSNFNYNMNFNNNEVNIYDCFLYDQRINYMMGENAMYCNYCKRQCNSQMCTLLAFGPEIIIIILNRGQGAQFKVKVNFQEQLNLYHFIEYKDTGVNYQLIGVITHLGGNDMSGHFIAYCKNPISNLWYQYNDSIVNEVNQANFKAEVIDYAMPYLLFYQKIGK